MTERLLAKQRRELEDLLNGVKDGICLEGTYVRVDVFWQHETLLCMRATVANEPFRPDPKVLLVRIDSTLAGVWEACLLDKPWADRIKNLLFELGKEHARGRGTTTVRVVSKL
jgi:hypothetical protein